MVPFCLYSNPALTDAMGALWHQATLEIGFRQHVLESSLLAISIAVDFMEATAGSGREVANNVMFHHSSVPSNVSFVCCLLSRVTFWLEQCLNVSSKERKAARTALAGKLFHLEI